MKRYRPRNDNGNENDSDGYKVGYGKPPEHSRFRPGKSGNPKGRPRGVHNLGTDVKATLRAPVTVTRNGKPKKITTQAAVLLRLREKALAGGDRPIERLIDLARAYGEEGAVASTNVSAEDQALLEIFQERVASGAVDLAAGSTSRAPSPRRKRRGKEKAS